MESDRVVVARVPEALAQEVEALGLDVAKACSDGLWLWMRKQRRDREWADEHRAAMLAFNAWLEEHGLTLERYRAW